MREKWVSKGMMNKCRMQNKWMNDDADIYLKWRYREPNDYTVYYYLPPQWAMTFLKRCRYIDKMLNSLQNRRTLQARKKKIFKVIPIQCDITYLVFDFLVLLKSLTISHFSLQQLKHWQHWLETNFLQNARWIFPEKQGAPCPLSQLFLSRRRIICPV